ncbi:MAG TPA: hypothetical protein PLB35_09250 [Myxococcota bacterium]|nr:hypothetical protein [Myxococcota bacterium]HOH77428.1 hypothetical protein [Myxococcota bacterium]
MLSRKLLVVAAVTVASLLGVTGCGDDPEPVRMDTFGQQDGEDYDVLGETTEGDVVPDAGRDSGPDNVWEVAPDPGGHDQGSPDVQSDVVEDVMPDVVQDVPPDVEPETVEDTVEPPTACTSYDDCADDEVCLFSMGVCQQRATWTSAALGLFNIHSLDGTVGDRIIIDGERFHTGGFLVDVKVKIGTVMYSGNTVAKDENRLYVSATAGVKGPITVYDKDNKVATIAGPFRQTEKGVVACDGSTPAASGKVPDNPWAAGPYAAGYVDITGDSSKTRVYYPAECGSVRRPAAEGTWPLVVILHGNGALHLQYEYLAELLATWGFVTIVPETIQNLAGEDYSQLIFNTGPLVQSFRGVNLGSKNAVLQKVTTTSEVFWIGHSRGTGRIEELCHVNDYGEWDATVGELFLGPVDDGIQAPGLTMIIGATKDMQSTPATYKNTYNTQAGIKWLVDINGGNHGSFCDHKVYGYGVMGGMGDKEPTISRHRQHVIVQMFAVPLIQRAFGLDEPFADYLETPPVSGDYSFEYDD